MRARTFGTALPLVLAGLAVAAEAGTAVIVAILYGAAFGDSRTMSEGSAVGASYVVLGFGSMIAVGAIVVAVYTSLARWRRAAAASFVCVVCVPTLLLAVAMLYGTLACLALI